MGAVFRNYFDFVHNLKHLGLILGEYTSLVFTNKGIIWSFVSCWILFFFSLTMTLI